MRRSPLGFGLILPQRCQVRLFGEKRSAEGKGRRCCQPNLGVKSGLCEDKSRRERGTPGGEARGTVVVNAAFVWGLQGMPLSRLRLEALRVTLTFESSKRFLCCS